MGHPEPERVVLALAGPHGVGKSRHTDALARNLVAEGVNAIAVHHAPPPPWCVRFFDRALWFALERVRLLATTTARVIVADRWDESTDAAARVALDFEGEAMNRLAASERALRAVRVHWLLLDASDTELDVRLAARTGRGSTPAERAEALALREFTTRAVRTDRPVAEVEREVLAWALRCLAPTRPL